MIKHVLAAIDFSHLSDDVIELASGLAEACDAALTVLHVAAPDPDFVGYEIGPQHVRDHRADELREEHKLLERLADRLRERGIETRFLMVQGATVETILAQARERMVDHIVVGAHHRSRAARLLLGSVSKGVLRGATCAVTVVPPHA